AAFPHCGRPAMLPSPPECPPPYRPKPWCKDGGWECGLDLKRQTAVCGKCIVFELIYMSNGGNCFPNGAYKYFFSKSSMIVAASIKIISSLNSSLKCNVKCANSLSARL